MTRLSNIKERFEDRLLGYPNVIGVETGLKEVNGVETDEDAILVSVRNKVPEDMLDRKEVIPKTIEGFKTDVIETGEILIPPLMKLSSKGRTDKWRPIPMSVSTGHPDITAGTFGTLVERDGEIMGLSNNHVWANSNKAKEGDLLLQPGSYDSGELPDDKFGKLYDYIKISLINPSNCLISKGVIKLLNGISRLLGRRTRFEISTEVRKNEVDAALSKVLSQDDIAHHVLGSKDKRFKTGYKKLYHKGSREARVNEEVWASGRTLGYIGKESNAYVKSKDATIQVRYHNGLAIFKNQVHVKSESKFSAGGMSGSAIVGLEDDKVIALLFAGNQDGTHTYGNKIEIVERLLDSKVVDMREV